jgi:hypothetical protein
MKPDARPGAPTGEEPAARPYHSPEFHIYGDIRTITQANKAGAMSDTMTGKTN